MERCSTCYAYVVKHGKERPEARSAGPAPHHVSIYPSVHRHLTLPPSLRVHRHRPQYHARPQYSAHVRACIRACVRACVSTCACVYAQGLIRAAAKASCVLPKGADLATRAEPDVEAPRPVGMADLEDVTALLSTRKRRETDGHGTRVDAQSAATLARLDASHAILTADVRQRNEEATLRRVVVERQAALVRLDGEVDALVRRAAAPGEGTVDECEELCEGMAALLESKQTRRRAFKFVTLPSPSGNRAPTMRLKPPRFTRRCAWII